MVYKLGSRTVAGQEYILNIHEPHKAHESQNAQHPQAGKCTLEDPLRAPPGPPRPPRGLSKA